MSISIRIIFSRSARSSTASRARRAGRSRDRSGRLRKGQRASTSRSRSSPGAKAHRQTKNHHRKRRKPTSRSMTPSSNSPLSREIIYYAMRFSIFLFLTSVSFARRLSAPTDAPYNSATISGLNARNIGSATMSGRVAAIAANRNPRANLRSLSAQPVAASGNRKTAAPIIVRSSTNNRCNRSARSRSIRKTPRTSGSARANPGCATAFRSATASTSRPMAARPGTNRACRTRNASRKSSLVRRTATLFMPRCRAHSGAIRPIAVSTKRPTAARTGT